MAAARLCARILARREPICVRVYWREASLRGLRSRVSGAAPIGDCTHRPKCKDWKRKPMHMVIPGWKQQEGGSEQLIASLDSAQ
ncbi:unnamed protein product [Urochloa humidicola]